LDYCNYLTGLTWNDITPQFNNIWHTNGYLQYLILLHAWAQSLGCEAFQIELWLSGVVSEWNHYKPETLPDDPKDIALTNDTLDI